MQLGFAAPSCGFNHQMSALFPGGLGELGPQKQGSGGAPGPDLRVCPNFQDAREPVLPRATPCIDTTDQLFSNR
jgi:hypothetical protein